MVTTANSTQSLSYQEQFEKSLYELPDGERIRNCIQCGTCSGICPFSNWMEFTPRKIIAALREGTFDRVLASDTIWMCVSCYACTTACPQQIPIAPVLMTRIKEELVLAGRVPAELQTALQNSQRYGNSLGESPRKRADWSKDINPPPTILRKSRRPVDVLWYVGDYASYHPRVQLSVKALAKVLNALGVDFGILGPEEVSDGDSQRLAGEGGLFEVLSEKNARSFSKYEFGEIITMDPHAFNALKNEYPRLGISYPVRHYTQFLSERLDQLTPFLTKEIEAIVAYHDPCYLGRANGIYAEPRDLIHAIPGVVMVEMSHRRANSLCCGGGGGGMWLDGFRWERSENRLSEWRVREAMNAQPETRLATPLRPKHKRKARREKKQQPSTRILAVACPYEIPRFEDAAKMVAGAENLIIKDVAELLAEAMDE
jgi:Fe-S oxidoreductase